MFGRREVSKKANFLPLVILRITLSTVVLIIFALGIYQAFRYFSGVDPLKLNPDQITSSVLTTPEVAQVLHFVLGVKLPKQINQLIPGNLSTNHKEASSAASLKVPVGKLALKFAIVADSHQDNDNLAKALSIAKTQGAKFVIGLGDYSDTGRLEDLEQAKSVFESSGLPFYTIAGDHDLWVAREQGFDPLTVFSQVFGSAYQSFGDSNISFVLLFNSDKYLGVDQVQLDWLQEQLQNTTEDKKIMVFLHEPIYHPTSDQTMGSARKNENKQASPAIQSQAEALRKLFKETGVVGVFAGDIHSFTQYQDPESDIRMVTVGAISQDRNTKAPRFVLIDVYTDGSYNVEDMEIK